VLFALSKIDLGNRRNPTEALARGLDAVGRDAAVAPRRGLDIEVAELTAGRTWTT